ncbi:hypothetical protein GCM10009868_08600 [Terrabacter aerolatus]|uniref:Uncharacterized protein n=1 Tax=Terrabacter aerolatus TaxID=422442 RepID=A0A512D5W0_9MICO|nr:hypothetical protein [Terrabacter aerolatus]GEO31855.1 hypothetical protein TAE01_36650 [Terrabacter aerolatus]
MPDTRRGADRTKVLSVRLTEEELEALSTRATEIGVGPSTLARTFVRQALAATATTTPSPPSPSAPSEPSAPAASPAPATRPAEDSTFEAQLRARLEALLAADLVTRVEALERCAGGH